MSLLKTIDINLFYGDVHILRDVSITVNEGEIVGLIGANGAGKSTTINAISGLLKPRTGQILFEGIPIHQMALHEVARIGIAQVPEGRRLFPHMSVRENLEIGAYGPLGRKDKKRNLEKVFEMLPRLKERENQLARTMSGGEQQMVAVGRGLMASPKLLILDEPSLGLAPLVTREIFDTVEKINQMGTTILLVEQDVQHSLSMSDRAYVLENGQVVMEGKGQKLLEDPHVKDAYLGI